MWLASSLREGGLGYDYFVYKQFYEEIITQGNQFSYEPAFYHISLILNKFHLPFHSILFAYSSFFHYCLFKAAKESEKQLSLNPSIFLITYIGTFYFWHAYTLTRQSAVIAFAMIMIFNNQAKKYIFLQPLFHTSGMALIPFVALNSSRKNIFFISSFLTIAVIVAFPNINEIIQSKLVQYQEARPAGIIPLLEFLIALIVIQVCKEKFYQPISQQLKILRLMAIIGLVTSILALQNEAIIRMAEPFRISIILAYCMLLKYSKNLGVNFYAISLTLFCSLLAIRLFIFIETFGEYSKTIGFIIK